MTVEVCVDSVTQASKAEANGATRLELCANLNDGGTTPSAGMIEAVCSSTEIPVYTMIRPRPGNFVFDRDEMEIMKSDITTAKRSGAKGVVFGVLLENGWIDVENTLALLQTARSEGMHVTFHRAFDVCPRPDAALAALIQLQIDNILTSGQRRSAFEGLTFIQQLVEAAEGHINIIAGGGVSPENVLSIKQSGVQAIHFTARKKAEEINGFDFGEHWDFDTEKLQRIVSVF